MSTLEKRVNLLAVALPFAGTIAAIVLLWNSVVSATDLAILAVMYVLTGFGVTVGFHRMLTHRSFQAPKPLEYAFAVLGSMAVHGPMLHWVADHRKHHAHADHEGDPHSPHVGHGSGLKGLWYAHTGWLMETQGQADWKRYAGELYEDPKMRRIVSSDTPSSSTSRAATTLPSRPSRSRISRRRSALNRTARSCTVLHGTARPEAGPTRFRRASGAGAPA